MRRSIPTTVFSTLSILLSHSLVTAQAASATSTGLKAISTLACYKSYQPLTLFGEYAFATSGWCQEQCGGLNQPVMAITGGSTCYCGSTAPALDQQVASSNCNTPCNGFGTQNCGGNGFWQLYLTGMTTNYQTAPNSTSSSSSSSQGSSTVSASPSVITKAGETIVVTASASAPPSHSGSPSKVGIAVGVVIGLLFVGGLIGGLALFLKQRRKKAIEEEHMRNAINANKKSETSSADSRLDPVIFSHRRESIGSIADEMDYSRRILQVRNPDHRASHQSGLVS